LAKNVQSIIDDLQSGLAELRMHFESLGSIFGGSEIRVRRARRVSPGRKPTRKKPNLSPAVRAQRKLQGRYMALIKRLPKAKQAHVKRVRATKGYEAALKLMG